jgi:hypothetical protein
MTSSPVMTFNSAITPFPQITSLALSGNGYNGAIPAGSSSTVATILLYNNFAGAASIADALNCVLAVYDNTTNQGSASTAPTYGLYVQVQVTNYNGNTTGADTAYFAIGGQTKHPVPTNSGTISGAINGTSGNYITINVMIVVPPTATQSAVTQGLWVEYSSTS